MLGAALLTAFTMAGDENADAVVAGTMLGAAPLATFVLGGGTLPVTGPPPRICLPTMATLAAYASGASILYYHAQASVSAYSSTSTLMSYQSNSSVISYSSVATVPGNGPSRSTITGYVSSSTIVEYVSTAGIDTCMR
jgi:hypothetical protein